LGDVQVLISHHRILTGYVTLLAAAAIGLCATLIATGYRLESPLVVLCLAIATAVSERWSVRVSATTELTVYLLPTVFAAVVFGPLAAGIIAAASMLGDTEVFRHGSRDRAPVLKWINYTAASFITGALAGLTAQFFDGESLGAIVASTFAAMAVAEASDFLFAVVTAQVRRRSMRELAVRGAPVALTSFLVYAPVVVFLVLAYLKISPVTILLFVVPTLAFQRLYTLYQRERRLGDDLRTANDTLERANLSFAVALVTALEASDAYTAGHSRAVAIYCRDIARRMGMSPDECDRAFLCGLVHDIGKVGLPPSLLGKEGPLTLEERRRMQEHSAIGERILREVDAYDDVATIVRFHHERIDGEGYPDGIHGDDIPMLSRVIAVADAYNAMTSHRPYREAMPSRVARLRLAQAVENQFDTTVVAAFEAILASVDDSYRSATSEEFRPGQPSVADESDASARGLAVGAA
jgi:HD-GYP domain-containing protein (c-di-GMP phosphodiesterase class II)